ncbi:MAG TPA: hypothetical protein VKJ45_22150 [Blastocatellia bacterium]|nr:hypothetical protein [Blastocatellia bacterium]
MLSIGDPSGVQKTLPERVKFQELRPELPGEALWLFDSLTAMSEEARRIEKLRRVEELFARPGTEGERVAAERARERILARLREAEKVEPAIEYHFSLNDQWSRRLFVALLRRYGIAPYRYSGQRRTTVMARVSKAFVNDTLWPEFQALNQLCKNISMTSLRGSSRKLLPPILVKPKSAEYAQSAD